MLPGIAPSSPASPRTYQRAVVPDVLRGIALVAMLLAHSIPAWRSAPWSVSFVLANVNDVASPLFALVMGMSAQLLLSRTPREHRGRYLLQQILRGAVLIGLGVWLDTWGTWVAVVLAFLGTLLILGTPILLLGPRVVTAAALATALLSAPLVGWAQGLDLPRTGAVAEVLQWLVLSRSYRVANLLPFFLFGAVLATHGFRRDRWLWTMLAVAPVAYLVRPVGERLVGLSEMSGTYQDTLHDLGLVLATYVAVVLLAEVRREPWQKTISAVFHPLRGIGQLALSLYLLHVGFLWLWGTAQWHRHPDDPLLWLVVVGGTMTIGLLWWKFVGTGPVEWLMGLVTGRRKPLRTAASEPRSPARAG